MSTCTAAKYLIKTSRNWWNQTLYLCSSLPYNRLRLQGTKRNSLLLLHLLVWEFYSQTASSIIFSKTLICVKKTLSFWRVLVLPHHLEWPCSVVAKQKRTGFAIRTASIVVFCKKLVLHPVFFIWWCQNNSSSICYKRIILSESIRSDPLFHRFRGKTKDLARLSSYKYVHSTGLHPP
jgi:hypothetical protein